MRVTVAFDGGHPSVDFAVRDLLVALQRCGLDTDLMRTDLTRSKPASPAIIIRRRPRDPSAAYLSAVAGGEQPPTRDESFTVTASAETVIVEAAEPAGLLYGTLELAEQIERHGWPMQPALTHQEPALALRGVKFNLPYEPYAPGEPFAQNESTAWSMDFWAGFLDELARSRYNLLTLWSEHPWHLLVTSPRFRGANSATDAEMARRQSFFRELLQYADDRAIAVVLFTWNVCLTTEAATALGVPDLPRDETGFSPEAVRIRQHSPQVQDYLEEMIYQTLVTYPLLRGIGTTASETMVGSARERQQWVTDVYVSAYERSGRRPWFIQRTNMQGAGREIKELIQPRLPKERFFISWKYANAHAYSHPRPRFEELWKAWEGVDLENTNVLFTVRNDDVTTHRWSDAEFVKEFVEGMRKPYVRGFYWGSDGYVFGRDFQHVDHGHKTWTWDYERHALQFQLWGRLAFDPTASPGLSTHLLQPHHHGLAEIVSDGLAHASRIVPAVNRLLWRDYDYMWHPEICLSRADGFRTVLDIMDAAPMPGVPVISIADWARKPGAHSTDSETPDDIIALLRASAATARVAAEALTDRRDEGTAETACVALDLRALASLGEYYASKIQGAVDLARVRATRDRDAGARAVSALGRARDAWKEIAFHWGQHYRPYTMPRTGRVFGYLYYLDDVENDIHLAEQLVEAAL